jgi:hypothetical protein
LRNWGNRHEIFFIPLKIYAILIYQFALKATMRLRPGAENPEAK